MKIFAQILINYIYVRFSQLSGSSTQSMENGVATLLVVLIQSMPSQMRRVSKIMFRMIQMIDGSITLSLGSV